MKGGFRLGFSMGEKGMRASGRNIVSAGEQPQVVRDYLADKVKAQRVWLVGSQEVVRGVHCSPFGVIPKKGKPGKWRLILNLSAPDGASVNDGIPKELCLLEYVSVDELVVEVLKRGVGTVAKADFSRAYWNVPVHSEVSLGDGMGGPGVCGWHTAVWSAVGPPAVHGTG